MVYTDKIYIAKKIKLARKKARFTQKQLAEKVGISTAHLSRIELGTYIPSLPTFLLMANVLGLDLSDFGVEKESKNPIRDEILKIINAADSNELEYYFMCLKTLSENISLIK